MSIFTLRRAHALPPQPEMSIRPEDMVNNRDEVLQSIEKLGLPLESIYIVGSAALTLAGLARRAHDVDIVTEAGAWNDIFDNQRLPNGAEATLHQEIGMRNRIQVSSEALGSILPIDLIFASTSILSETSFEHFREVNGVLTPEGICIASLSQVSTYKELTRAGVTHPYKIATNTYDLALAHQAWEARLDDRTRQRF